MGMQYVSKERRKKQPEVQINTESLDTLEHINFIVFNYYRAEKGFLLNSSTYCRHRSKIQFVYNIFRCNFWQMTLLTVCRF